MIGELALVFKNHQNSNEWSVIEIPKCNELNELYCTVILSNNKCSELSVTTKNLSKWNELHFSFNDIFPE